LSEKKGINDDILMKRTQKVTWGAALSGDKLRALQFLKRVMQAKLDPAILNYGEQVSGLYEDSGRHLFSASTYLVVFQMRRNCSAHFRE
jgi:hypothetical protein